jgi:hypothetical protein
LQKIALNAANAAHGTSQNAQKSPAYRLSPAYGCPAYQSYGGSTAYEFQPLCQSDLREFLYIRLTKPHSTICHITPAHHNLVAPTWGRIRFRVSYPKPYEYTVRYLQQAYTAPNWYSGCQVELLCQVICVLRGFCLPRAPLGALSTILQATVQGGPR